MARLRESPDDLFALVGAASDYLRIPQEFVEKDFWVTELLRSAARPIEGALVIFKGGTSLSKAFGLIERFSEDVDILLSIQDSRFGKQRVHAILKGICTRAGDDLGIPANKQRAEGSETGIHRNVRYLYAARFAPALVTEGVLLEMGRRGGDLPRHRHLLGSMIARYVVETEAAATDEFEEFANFEIDVLAPERTLVEKLALLHRLSVKDEGAGLVGGGRHLYDVYKLLSDPMMRERLREDPETVSRLADDADAQSKRWGMPFEPRPEGGYGASSAFDLSSHGTHFLRESFVAARGLIYGSIPAFEECLEMVRLAADAL